MDSFYDTRQWKELRYLILRNNKFKCQACNAGKESGVPIHVDHIKPRSKYPELELDPGNLQILCENCNIGKSNKFEDDHRPGLGIYAEIKSRYEYLKSLKEVGNVLVVNCINKKIEILYINYLDDYERGELKEKNKLTIKIRKWHLEPNECISYIFDEDFKIRNYMISISDLNNMDWINHLREKSWFNSEEEGDFILLCKFEYHQMDESLWPSWLK